MGYRVAGRGVSWQLRKNAATLTTCGRLRVGSLRRVLQVGCISLAVFHEVEIGTNSALAGYERSSAVTGRGDGGRVVAVVLLVGGGALLRGECLLGTKHLEVLDAVG